MGSPTLDSLLKLVTSRRFEDLYWEQQFLHAKRMSQCNYQDLLTFAQLDILVRLALLQQSSSVSLVWSSAEQTEHGSIYDTTSGTPSTSAVYEHYADGYSVLVNRLHNLWPSVAELCLGLRDKLQCRVGANLYLTPAGLQGFQRHFDTHDVFILQIHGSKTWRIFETPVELPLNGDRLGKYSAYDQTCLADMELIAGDLLYIPRGLVHEGQSSATSSSLHLTIGVYAFRRLDVVREALERVAKEVRYLRESAVGLAAKEDDVWPANALDELWSRLRKMLSDPSTVKSIHTGLANFAPSLSARRFAKVDELTSITTETRLRRRDGVVCKVTEGREKSEIHFLGNWIRGPEFIHEALKYVAENHEFTVAELPDSLTDEGKLTLARRLVRNGLLLRSDETLEES